MRIKLILLLLLVSFQAFCAKKFFSGPNERELYAAYLVIGSAIVMSLFCHFLYYKTKWLALKILNIILLVVFIGIAFIGLLFSPPASIFGLFVVVTTFILSFKKSSKQHSQPNEISK